MNRRASCFLLLAALLWLGCSSAFAIRPQPLENRVGGYDLVASGQTSVVAVQSPENAMGLRACAYKTASGRFKWLNHDPIGERGGINLYGFVANNPINERDALGLQGYVGPQPSFSPFASQTGGFSGNFYSSDNPAYYQSVLDANAAMKPGPSLADQADQPGAGLNFLAAAGEGAMTVLPLLDPMFDPADAGLFMDLAAGKWPKGPCPAAETTANTPLALGLTDAGLEEFAQARGATIATGENWQTTVLDALNDPNTTVHFNLDQVDVWPGVQRAASGQGGPTDWELLQIQQNPQSWDTLQFWKGGQPAPNPFK